MRENRPKIKIEKDSIDQLIELVGAIFMVLMIAIPLYYFNQLPDEIPAHFGANGKVNRYDNKWTIWLLVAIGVGTYLLLNYVNKKPHTFNFPVKITEENAAIQYRIAMKSIRWINTLTACLFCYIAYYITMLALGKNSFLGINGIYIILVIYFLVIGYFLVKSNQNK